MVDLKAMRPDQAKITILASQDLTLDTVDNMKKYGGSFVKALGECLIRGDSVNRFKILNTFWEYIIDYTPSEMAKKKGSE
jgi:hypothetical protein